MFVFLKLFSFLAACLLDNDMYNVDYWEFNKLTLYLIPQYIVNQTALDLEVLKSFYVT